LKEKVISMIMHGFADCWPKSFWIFPVTLPYTHRLTSIAHPSCYSAAALGYLSR